MKRYAWDTHEGTDPFISRTVESMRSALNAFLQRVCKLLDSTPCRPLPARSWSYIFFTSTSVVEFSIDFGDKTQRKQNVLYSNGVWENCLRSWIRNIQLEMRIFQGSNGSVKHTCQTIVANIMIQIIRKLVRLILLNHFEQNFEQYSTYIGNLWQNLIREASWIIIIKKFWFLMFEKLLLEAWHFMFHTISDFSWDL